MVSNRTQQYLPRLGELSDDKLETAYQMGVKLVADGVDVENAAAMRDAARAEQLRRNRAIVESIIGETADSAWQ